MTSSWPRKPSQPFPPLTTGGGGQASGQNPEEPKDDLAGPSNEVQSAAAPSIASMKTPLPPFQAVQKAPVSDDEEMDLEADATRIDTQNFVAEQTTNILQDSPNPPFLLVEGGSDRGKQFVVGVGETSVGRSIDNDIILTDIAISRRHIRVLRSGDVMYLRDLGSGNGTKVNGEKAVEVQLNHGDLIEIGETKMRVQIPGEEANALPAVAALPSVPVGGTPVIRSFTPTPEVLVRADARSGPPRPSLPPMATPSGPGSLLGSLKPPFAASSTQQPAPADGPRQVTPRFMIISTTVFFILAGLILYFSGGEAPPPAEPQLPPGAQTPEELALDKAREQQADQFVASARQAMAQGQRVAAEQFARNAYALAPERDTVVALIRELRATENTVAQADPSQPAALPEAPAAEPAPPPEAAPEAQRPEPTTETVTERAPRRDSPRNAQPVARRESTPTRVAPPPRVSALPTRSSSTPASLPTPLPSRTSTETSTASTANNGRPAVGAALAAGAETRALNAYRQSNFEAASQIARNAIDDVPANQRERLQSLAERIDRFAAVWPRVRRAGTNLRPVLRDAQTAISLDESISGGDLTRQLKTQLVDALIADARAAASANRWADACPAARRAAGIDASNAGVRSLLGACDQRATTLLDQAARAEASDPSRARALYREVMTLIPQSTDGYRRAYQRLNVLARAAQIDEDE